MTPWRYLYFADAHHGDAMADSFVSQVVYLSRTERDAAVFRFRLPGGAAHYYFAPGAALIAERFLALPCSAPLLAQRGELLAGRLSSKAVDGAPRDGQLASHRNEDAS
jgi:hypothetical protein